MDAVIEMCDILRGWKITNEVVMPCGTANTIWYGRTKYRYQVLKGDVGTRCRVITRDHNEYGNGNLCGINQLGATSPLQLSVSRVVQHLKGKRSHRLLRKLCKTQFFRVKSRPDQGLLALPISGSLLSIN